MEGYGDKFTAGWKKHFGAKSSSTFGRLASDRKEALDWEKFRVIVVDKDAVAIAGHTGFLSMTEKDGKKTISAVCDRREIGAWEKMKLSKNEDGTVSIFSIDWNCYLIARPKNDEGIDNFWDKSTIFLPGVKDNGPNRKSTRFKIEFHNDGSVSFKAWDGLYLSARAD